MADSPGFLLSIPFLLFGETAPIAPEITETPGFVLSQPDLRFSTETTPLQATRVERSGFLLQFMVGPRIEGDTGFVFLPDDNTIPSFPADLTMVEILYPVKPLTDLNRVLFQVGTEEWRRTIKSNTPVPKDMDTIRFRVDTSYLPTFLGELESNKLNQFRLNTPGYTPFGSESSDNFVRVFGHGRPRRESDGFTQLVDVTFLFVAAI